MVENYLCRKIYVQLKCLRGLLNAISWKIDSSTWRMCNPLFFRLRNDERLKMLIETTYGGDFRQVVLFSQVLNKHLVYVNQCVMKFV